MGGKEGQVAVGKVWEGKGQGPSCLPPCHCFACCSSKCGGGEFNMRCDI